MYLWSFMIIGLSILELSSGNHFTVLSHCDLDLWHSDLKINRGHLPVMINEPMKFHDPRPNLFLSYHPETIWWTDRLTDRQTDRQTDQLTRAKQYTPLLSRGHKYQLNNMAAGRGVVFSLCPPPFRRRGGILFCSCRSVRPPDGFRMITQERLCHGSWNFIGTLIMTRRWPLLILRSKVKVTRNSKMVFE